MYDNLDKLMNDLLRPTYVYRMSHPSIGRNTPAQVKSAQTRNKNAKKEIQNLIYKYAGDEGWL